jgi:hypothetical protein
MTLLKMPYKKTAGRSPMIPIHIYDRFFLTLFVQELVTQTRLYLITYSIASESLEKWIPLPNTVST